MSLQANGVTKNYKNYAKKKFAAIDHISFEIEEGNVCALIGQNGAGKTTLIKSLLRMISLDMGEFTVDGGSVENLLKQNDVGFMPEVVAGIRNITGEEYIQGLMDLRGISWDEVKERYEGLVKLLHLSKYMQIPMQHCSKGNFKKIIFIQAVLHNPRLVVLDEPTDGLDPISRKNMLDEIKRLKENGGYTIISTHILSDIEKVADQVMILQLGKLLSSVAIENIGQSLEDWYIKQIKESGALDEI